MPVGVDQDFADRIRAERKRDRDCARLFVDAVKAGDVDSLLWAVGLLNDQCVDGWRLALRGVGRLPAATKEIHAAFLNVWVESKSMSRNARDRPTLARALRILLPRDYDGPPLKVYRGTRASERRRGIYGFSWTTSRAIAEAFATEQERKACEGKAKLDPDTFSYADNRGIVLMAMAAPDAVLLKREPEDYYDEEEVVIDPYRLSGISSVRLKKGQRVVQHGTGSAQASIHRPQRRGSGRTGCAGGCDTQRSHSG